MRPLDLLADDTSSEMGGETLEGKVEYGNIPSEMR
jgi:hypothetical protein